MGYDANWVGNFKYKRMKIAFFPYQGGYSLASTATGQLPGTVYLGRLAANGQSNVYRVDAGGPEIDATDGGPNWSEDDGAQPERVPQPAEQHGRLRSRRPPERQRPVDHAGRHLRPRAVESDGQSAQSWDFPVPAGTHRGAAVLREPVHRHQPGGSAGLQRQPRWQHCAAQLRHRGRHR
jgi:hypothetical protein